MWSVFIRGQKTTAKVTNSGELVTAALKYSDTKFVVLDTANTAFNFYQPQPKSQFVITGFNIKADRQVSNTVDANVIIYEGSSPTDITAAEEEVIFQEAMIRGERTGFMSTNILVKPGRWVNAKTTDSNIFMTVMGYFIDEL